MHRPALALYLVLLCTSYSANKFVLSTLGFQYPMVFQGWQTLVGFVLYQCLHSVGAIKITSLDMSGYISLFPFFLFFTSSILTGSMALSKIPLAAFLSLSSLVPVLACLASEWENRRKQQGPRMNKYQAGASTVIFTTSLALLALEQPAAAHEGYFWMEMHVLCTAGLVVYGRIADARFNSVDRQYYSYVFSLIVLLPASLYLEEAFEALNFQELYQLMFLGGSLVCAVAGMLLHFQQSRLRSDKRFGQAHHLSLIAVCVLSLVVFKLEFSSLISLALLLATMCALLFVPTFIQPEETMEDDLKTMFMEEI